MVPVHPGRILKRELAARGMSANRLALALRVPSGRITSILNGKRAISADTALRLAHHLGTSARFWMNLQSRYDLTVAERDHGARIAAEVDPAAGWQKRFLTPFSWCENRRGGRPRCVMAVRKGS
jgi:antitoxin HigA-1